MKQSKSIGKYRVQIWHPFYPGDESKARFDGPGYDTKEEAIARAQEIVFQECEKSGFDYKNYIYNGDDPSVLAPKGEKPVDFGSWEYAKEVCAKNKKTPQDRSQTRFYFPLDKDKK